MQVLRCAGLPDDPLEAAAHFHAQCLPDARAALKGGEGLVLVFAPLDHRHRTWVLAAVQALARDAAPGRVNAIAGADVAAITAALAYLDGAEGVTGQLLQLDGLGAGAVV